MEDAGEVEEAVDYAYSEPVFDSYPIEVELSVPTEMTEAFYDNEFAEYF
jgi:hypothetical protein